MTSATDELHWQLDTGYQHSLRPELHKALMNRGIDYWVAQGITFWNRDDGCECLAYGYKANGVPKLAIKVVGFTDPAEAIAATLGAGECKVESTTKWDWDRCEPYWEHGLSCGHTVTTMEPEPPNYCPECGAKVMDE